MNNIKCEICDIKYRDWMCKNSLWFEIVCKTYKYLCLNCFTNLLDDSNLWFLKLAKYKKEK